jgi:sugar O-acyltransferase (sialic acid O-acetyltransferase NeuD family)
MVKNNNKICIIGTGGFGREVLCCLIDLYRSSKINIFENVYFMVSDEYYKEETVMGVKVIKLSDFVTSEYNVFVAIGNPQARRKIVESLPLQTNYLTIIHPSALVSDFTEIGEGSIITAGTILTCNLKIGKHAHLNLNTTIGHDCVIGDYFTTAPATNISGNCKIGDSVYFGTNSAVKEGISICSDVTIGMGGVVVKDINEKGIYIGNPLRKLERK